MTDQQELLESAARAAGLEINKGLTGTLFVRKGVSQWCEWNPLTDDGDALRLAVKLGMMIDHNVETDYAQVVLDGNSYHEMRGADPCAATRRAIVLCAAEIGMEMTA